MLLGIAIGFALAVVPAVLFAAWHCKKLPSQAAGPLVKPRKPLASYIAKARRAALRRQQVVKW